MSQNQEWQRVGEDFSTYKFKLEEPFIGVYVATKDIVPEDTKKKPFKLHVFVDSETGEMHNLPDVHAVSKAISSIEDPTNTVFRFVFHGIKELGGKKSVNMIDAFTKPLN